MSLSPGFWDDNTRATGIMKEIKVNEYWIHLFQNVESRVEDFAVLFEFWKGGDASEIETKEAFDKAVLLI
jgi:peptide chain release factor 2